MSQISSRLLEKYEEENPETNVVEKINKKSLTEIPFVQSWYEQHRYVSFPTYEIEGN